jgi:hypothetical protein
MSLAHSLPLRRGRILFRRATFFTNINLFTSGSLFLWLKKIRGFFFSKKPPEIFLSMWLNIKFRT